MKRARPAPSMFGDDSDSDHITRRPLSRFRPPAGVSAQTKATCADALKQQQHAANSCEHEDTLDAFMSSLHHAQTDACNAQNEAAKAKEESESDDAPPQHDAQRVHAEARDAADTHARQMGGGEQHARDLKLQAVDYSNVKLCKVVWSAYKARAHVDDSHQTLAQELQQMGALMHNGSFRPLSSFDDVALQLPKALLSALQRAFAQPTPIQRVAIPAALGARDLSAVASTGSGKTLAYGVPLLAHVARQPRSSGCRGGGPVALVLSPTRELAAQIAHVLHRFDAHAGVLCVVGGHAKYEQFKRMRDSRVQVIVATPGRLIDMLKMRACGMRRCSFVVVDEADRMLDLGFSEQLRAIVSQLRPDAQRLLFSATFPRAVRRLAQQMLRNAVRVVVGGGGGGDGDSMVNHNVSEKYRLFATDAQRLQWLLAAVVRMREQGLVIVFCGTRGEAAAVANAIRSKGVAAACIHGETDAADRDDLLKMFRNDEVALLVTTDLSARGLDIEQVRNVVNYGCARSWEWHVHRVGRTGRAGRRGTAWTLVVKGNRTDCEFVGDALKAYARSGGDLPEGLHDVAACALQVGDDEARGARGRRRRAAGCGR